MKKRDFQTTVKTLVAEHYGISEEKPFNDAGEPLMTHQQYLDHSESAEPEEMEKQMPAPNTLSKFENIDWKALFEILERNTRIFEQLQGAKTQPERDGLLHSLTPVSDITEGYFGDGGICTLNDLKLLEDADIVYIEKNNVSFQYSDENFESFKTKAQQAWANPPKPSYGGNDSEAPYLRGYEPMSEEFLGAVYEHFQAYLKEGITKLDFAKKIRGVVYEYAQGAPAATPTTQDPVRDPDNIKQQGQDMQTIGKKIEDVGKTAEDIKNKNAVKGSVSAPTLREYVEEAIFPAVLEIMKEAERPRATKRELLEMFKLGK